MLVRAVVPAALAVQLCACATIVNGPKQAIQIDSNPPGATVFTAVRKEGRGGVVHILKRVEAGVTPLSVSIPRKDGVVFLEKAGYQPVEVPLKRGVNPWVLGDVLMTSLLATSIDTSTGAAHEYDPDAYMVELQAINP